jgi:hypothetical protein
MVFLLSRYHAIKAMHGPQLSEFVKRFGGVFGSDPTEWAERVETSAPTAYNRLTESNGE